MKVLLCHNYYQQRGGEDVSFDAEADLLESHGHRVLRFVRHNDEITRRSRLTVAGQTLWSRSAARELDALIREERPAVMHCTNVFPLVSPSVYRVARRHGLPVLQALRNYRAFCVNGTFSRGGRLCQDCLGRPLGWRGVTHGCYRGSISASAVVLGWQQVYRRQIMREGMIDLFYAPSQYAKAQYVAGGLDPARVEVKPNFTEPVQVSSDPEPGRGALFVGRLSQGKGVAVLRRAWEALGNTGPPLQVVGVGPEEPTIAEAAQRGLLSWHGALPHDRVIEMMASAAFVVIPSVNPETFGRTVIEAYACGRPVIATRVGALPELVRDGETGYLCTPGDASDLAIKAQRLAADPDRLRRMGAAARRCFESSFTPERNHGMLVSLYERAIEVAKDRRRSSVRKGELGCAP